MEQTHSTQSTTSENGKMVSVLSYLTIIGWVIAYVMHNNEKSELGAFHLRQTIGLYIIGICIWIAQMMLVLIPVLGWIIGVLMIFLYIGLLILWLIGLIAAINGNMKPIPVIGKNAQHWFSGIK